MLKLLCYIPANLDVKTDNWFLTPTRASVKTDWSCIPVKVVFKKGTMKGPVKIQLEKDNAKFHVKKDYAIQSKFMRKGICESSLKKTTTLYVPVKVHIKNIK